MGGICYPQVFSAILALTRHKGTSKLNSKEGLIFHERGKHHSKGHFLLNRKRARNPHCQLM